MTRNLAIVLLPLGLLTLAGCFRADDGRAIGRIRDENASLRATMQDLERRHSSLAAAVQTQEQQKDSLKRQRRLVKKERDRYKKLLDKDD